MKSNKQHQGFNIAEASAFLNKRWAKTLEEMNDSKVPQELRPKEHMRTTTVQGGWGHSKLHMQPSVNNFLHELSEAIQRTQAKKASKA